MKSFLFPAVWLAATLAGRAALTLDVAPSPKPAAPGIVVPAPVRGSSTEAATPAGKAEDVLKFKNGDKLHGILVAASPDEGICWSREDTRSAIRFALANVAEIQLGNVAAPPLRGPRAVAHLTNGDSLSGEIVALSQQTLQFRTWYAGELALKRPMLASLEPGLGTLTVLYAGPNSITEWQQRVNRTGQGWTFKKGALVASGGSGGTVIGRDVKLPDTASIECDIGWMGYANVLLLFYAENFENYYNSDCYALQISSGTVYLQRCQRNSGMNNVDQPINVDSLQRKNKAHIALKVNKQKKTISLFLDGSFVKQWTDRADFAGRGTGLGFVTQGQPIRISNIVVSEWDGKLDLDAGAPGAAAEEDIVRLINGDKLTGRLDTIANGQLQFATSYARLEVPLTRVAEVLLATRNAEMPRRQANDLRAFFGDGGRLTLALEKLGADTLSGASESFGKAVFQRGAFQRLQFNIYDERKESEEDDDWADTPLPAGGGIRRILRGAAGGGIIIDGGALIVR